MTSTPKFPKRLKSLPLPPNLQEEWDAWANSDPDDPNASRRPPESQRSARIYLREYGHMLHYAHILFASDVKARPDAIWGQPTIDGVLRALGGAGYSAATIKLRFNALERALAVLSPDSDRTYVNLVISNIPRPGRSQKFQNELRDKSELIDLGKDLMRRAETDTTDPIESAYRFMIGFFIALLAERPLREATIRTMACGPDPQDLPKNVKASLTRKGSGYLIKTQATTRRPMNHTGTWRRRPRVLRGGKSAPTLLRVPDHLVADLEKWLQVYRPKLHVDALSGPSMWLTRRGDPIGKTQLLKEVKRATKARFGAPMTIQEFRSAFAMSERRASPDKPTNADFNLGHTRKMTYAKYLKADPKITMQTGERVQATFDALLAASGLPKTWPPSSLGST